MISQVIKRQTIYSKSILIFLQYRLEYTLINSKPNVLYLTLLLLSMLYSVVLFLNAYVSKQPDYNFLSPILMSLLGFLFIVLPPYFDLSLKRQILYIVIVNIFGLLIYRSISWILNQR